ncbi:MAG: choice-of-anchor D domain-containing protein [Terriglobia bacterium]
MTDTTIGSATLNVYFAVDNAVNGVFINGSPISGNSYDGDYHAEYGFVRYDVGPLLQPNATNWLYLNVSDYGYLSALIFSATITTQAVATSVSISPSSGGNTGTVTATIGDVGGLPSGTTVTLSAAGQADIAATNVAFVNPTTLTATFDLTGAAPGPRQVVLSPPGGSAQTLSQAFTILEGGAPQIWVDVIGPPHMRINRQETFYVLYGNTGNVDAVGVPLWIAGIPTDATLSLGFNVLPPLSLGSTPIDYSAVPTSFNTGSEIVVPLLMNIIPAQSTGTLQFTVTEPNAETFQLQAWTNPPWFGSSQASGDNSVVDLFARVATKSHPSYCSRQRSGLQLDLSVNPNDLDDCVLALVNDLFPNPSLDCAKSWVAILQEFLKSQPPNIFHLLWTITVMGANCSQGQFCGACVESIVTFEPVSPVPCVACVVAILVAKGGELVSTFEDSQACTNLGLQIGEVIAQITSVVSVDPNDKVGSQGAGQAQFLSGQQPLRYAIDFGNEDTATAPAQQVVITDQLDTTNDNLGSLSLGSVNFGSLSLTPQPFERSYATTVDLRPATNLLVAVNASVVVSKGLLTWSFQSLDPTTMQPPTDPTVGFLPPGVGGSVFFTIMPNPGLPTNTQILNQASVVFDTNAPVLTPTWLNTMDNTPPTSSVQSLPSTEPNASFTVSWSGTDIGSGINNYTIYASDNGGAFTAWQQNTTATSATFAGQVGHTYGFYSIATDLVGNTESSKSSAEASTMVVPAPAVTVLPPSLTFANQNVGTASGSQPITLNNIGDAALTITSITASGDFSQTNTCGGSVAASSSCTINISFKPTTTGTSVGMVTITDNSNGVAGSTQTVSLTGSGTAPVAGVSTAGLTFAALLVKSTSNSQAVTLSNTGNLALAVASISTSGNFAETNNCASSVAASGSCTINITFTPLAGGPLTGTLTITDNSNNATGSTQSVSLTGTGQDFTLAAASGSPTSDTVAPGQSATYTLSVSGEGGFNQSVSLSCTGAPSEATCTATPSPVTAGSSATSITVTVTTTAPSVSAPRSRPLPPVPPLSRGLKGLLMLVLVLATMSWAVVRRKLLGVSRWQLALFPASAGLLMILALAGCGGGGGGGGGNATPSNPGTPAGTSTLTITGTAGSGSSALSHIVTLTLKVS